MAFTGDESRLPFLRRYGEVVHIPVPTSSPQLPIPSANWAKFARVVLAAQYPTDISVLHDMDSIVLQREYGERITAQRKKDHLLLVGGEVYFGPEAGKAQMSWLCGEGALFARMLKICAPKFRVYDNKESLHSPANVFSDESLIRVLVNASEIPVQRVPRDEDIYRDWVDRSWWHLLDHGRLHRGEYHEANLLRPLKANWAQIRPLAEYVTGRPVTLEEVLPW